MAGNKAPPARLLKPEKIRQFAAEYIANGFNGARAAITVGATKKSAKWTAWALLQREDVQKVVGEENARALAANRTTADEVLEQSRILGFSDPRKLVDAEGHPIPLQDLPDEIALAISGLEVIEQPDGTIKHKFKIADKNPSLDRLAKHFKLFEERPENTTFNFVNIGDMEVARRIAFLLQSAVENEKPKEVTT